MKLFESDQKPGPGAAGVRRATDTASTTMASKTTRETVLASGANPILNGVLTAAAAAQGAGPVPTVVDMDEAPNEPSNSGEKKDGDE